MTNKFDDWLNSQVDGDFSKLKGVHLKIQNAKKKSQGKRQNDLAVLDNILNHIVASGVYPIDPALDNVDFDKLI